MLFQKILQPFLHLQQVPGKQIRARLSHAYNYWLKIPADKLVLVNDAAEMLLYSILLFFKA
jgi:geranylgeranyl diphosphate synthase type 3